MRAMLFMVAENQYREELLEVAIAITEKHGVDDLAIVSISQNDSKTVVFQSDMFADLSDDEKVEIFREFNAQKQIYTLDKDPRAALGCSEKGSVVIVSHGTQYTAKIHEYNNGSYYKFLYADNEEILSDTYTYTEPSSSSSSSSSSSGSSSRACSGGSVGCRSGFHPCHEMSNGYCNQCCKG
jgi:hypothetical protein